MHRIWRKYCEAERRNILYENSRKTMKHVWWGLLRSVHLAHSHARTLTQEKRIPSTDSVMCAAHIHKWCTQWTLLLVRTCHPMMSPTTKFSFLFRCCYCFSLLSKWWNIARAASRISALFELTYSAPIRVLRSHSAGGRGMRMGRRRMPQKCIKCIRVGRGEFLL